MSDECNCDCCKIYRKELTAANDEIKRLRDVLENPFLVLQYVPPNKRKGYVDMIKTAIVLDAVKACVSDMKTLEVND